MALEIEMETKRMYEVVLSDMHMHRYVVEADNSEDAKNKAHDLFAADVWSGDIDHDSWIDDEDVTEIIDEGNAGDVKREIMLAR